MGFFIFIIMGVIVWQLVKFARKYGQATKDAWLWAAQELGLRLEEGGIFSGNKISGIIQGVGLVVVDTYSQSSGNTSTTYTRYVVRYERDLRMGMKLTKQGAMSGVVKMFGAQDVDVGDKVFDDQVMVKVNSRRGFQQFLTRERRRAITDAFLSWPQLKIEDDALQASTSGLERDPAKLVGTVRELVELARVVSVDGAEPKVQRSSPPPVPKIAMPAAMRQTVSPPPLVTPSPIDQVEEVVVPEPDPVPEPVAVGPVLASVCAELYRSGQSGPDAERLYAETYQGQVVRGVGTLRSAQRYSFDIVFGDTPAMRAMIDVYDDDSGGFGSRTVQAAVKFPEDMRDELTALSGQEVVFTGTLVKFDRLLRKLYVAGGRLVS